MGKPPMFGDFEAQRHWMELTHNLPILEWYKNSSDNDLLYWGLDYPPLTAYHSWLCGVISSALNSSWVELKSSRGLEDPGHKLFMRYSVIVVDLLIYIPAVFVYHLQRDTGDIKTKISTAFLSLIYPGLVLIDHGHFQYNCISLGLALWAVIALHHHKHYICSILFVLSLNYKQMELYHAMPFFCYLLGTCLQQTNRSVLARFLDVGKIGAIVLVTFVLCWLPFLGRAEAIMNVIHRLFPFDRGLFEDKVANLWCSLSVVIKLKNILAQKSLVQLCLGTTLLAMIPSSVDLLLRPCLAKFNYALINSSLVFFLFSYQVHEKSILLAALPACLVYSRHPRICSWFLIVTTFSMFPLLVKDGLVIASVLSVIIYLSFSSLTPHDTAYFQHKNNMTERFLYFMNQASLVCMLILCVASMTVSPPVRYPDIFPLLISAYSCLHFLAALLFFHWQQFITTSNHTSEHTDQEPAGKTKLKTNRGLISNRRKKDD